MDSQRIHLNDLAQFDFADFESNESNLPTRSESVHVCLITTCYVTYDTYAQRPEVIGRGKFKSAEILLHTDYTVIESYTPKDTPKGLSMAVLFLTSHEARTPSPEEVTPSCRQVCECNDR